MNGFKNGPFFGLKSNVETVKVGGVPPDEDQIMFTPYKSYDISNLVINLDVNGLGGDIEFKCNGRYFCVSKELFFKKIQELFGEGSKNVTESD